MLFSCSSATKKEGNSVSVSIPPLQYLVDAVSGGDFTTTVIVPPGASPETYEPTVRQVNELANSRIYFQTGLIDFERNLEQGVRHSAKKVRIVTLSEGMELSEGDCGHTDVNNNAKDEGHENISVQGGKDDSHSHAHGTDPHIWLSPARLRAMAATISKALEEALPDSASKYRSNYANLISRIDSVDRSIHSSINELNEKTIIIYHPSLTYFCEEYGLRQIAVEQEGKEPSVSHMKAIISAIREHNIRILFYQEQLHAHTIEAIVHETGIRAIPFDPLAYNVLDNLTWIADKLSNHPADGRR